MENLQNLYDYYLKTKPSTGKIRTATTLLIRICKALNTDALEDITPEMYKQIPLAIDEFYGTSSYKALQDKSMLAEMIGRYGPRNGWEEVLDILLQDADSNLRQFTLQSLSYYSFRDPHTILPYIEKYKNSEDTDLKNVSINLLCKLLTSEHSKEIFDHIQSWPLKEDQVFLNEVKDCLTKFDYSEIDPHIFRWFSDQAG
jgi:hypothetical protein